MHSRPLTHEGNSSKTPLKSYQKLPETATFFELLQSPQLPTRIQFAIAENAFWAECLLLGRKWPADCLHFGLRISDFGELSRVASSVESPPGVAVFTPS